MNYLTSYVILLLMPKVFIVSSHSETGSICFVTQAVSSVNSRVMYRIVNEYFITTTSCGIWGRRCNRTNQRTIRQSYTGYFTNVTYYSAHRCCPGYSGNSPDCEAICTGGCQNEGNCTLPDVCECASGWTGTNCETDIDECNGYHECDHNCANIEGSYECSCDPGYDLQSDNSTCEDINECETDNGGCEQLCVNTPGSYQCSCQNGYELTNDSYTCTDIGECLIGSHNCSQICVEVVGGFECDCFDGYELEDNRFTCKDIDECARGTIECSQGCKNTDGGAICTCNKGYQIHHEDPTVCVDIDECVESNGECQHICKNEISTYQCLCHSGYLLGADKHSCEDINECTDSNGGCQQKCTNLAAGYYCSCDAGYTLDENGHSCTSLSDSAYLGSNDKDDHGANMAIIIPTTVAIPVLVVVVVVVVIVIILFWRKRHTRYSIHEDTEFCEEQSQDTLPISFKKKRSKHDK